MQDKTNEKKQEEKPKKDGKNNEERYIYFIDSHDKSKQLKIFLDSEYKGADTLEKVQEVDMTNIDPSSSTTIYRFKILPEALKKVEGKKEYEIVIIVEEENGTQHQFFLNLRDIKKDYYEYNFTIEKVDILPLDVEIQFQIYVDLLRKKYRIMQESRENEEFILSTQQLIIGSDKQYNFLFYLLIFLECFSTKFIYRHLIIFRPEKIKGLGKVPEKKLKQIDNILTLVSKNPSKIHVQNENSRQNISELFYSMVLYFYIKFNREKIAKLFENEKAFNFLIAKLIDYKNLFKDLVLSKGDFMKLLEKSKNFENILTFLSYLGKDVEQFLKIIYEKREFILKIKEDEIEEKDAKKEDLMIELEKYIEPKKEDNINEIISVIEKLNGFQASEGKIIKYSSSVFERYVEYYDEVNLKNLILLKGTIESIKKVDKKFAFKYKMDRLIHENGLAFVRQGKLKNIELLDFIKTDEFYQNRSFDKPFFRAIEILDGIDISTLNEEFIEKWNQMNFYKIFDSQLNEYLKKVSLFINEIKDFSLLYSLYKNTTDNDYKYDVVNVMQNRFIEIFNTYTAEKCPNFKKDVIKLIYLSDKKKVHIKKFLVDFLQNNLDVEKVNEIYLTFIEEHQDLSTDIKSIIVDHFTKNKNNATPSNLINLIKICKKLQKDILSNINTFIIKEEDFLLVEETENLKFFKGIVKNDFLSKDSQFKGAIYIEKATLVISALESKINNDELKLGKISIFFQNEKLEKILYERLLYIYLLDENKAKASFEKLKTKYYTIKNYISDLEIIYRDLVDFFYISRPHDIEKLGKMLFELKNGKLNYFQNNCKDSYNNYISQINEAKKREEKKKSSLYNQLLKEAQIKFKENDKNILAETEKNFNEFKNLFSPDGIYKINKNLLDLFLNPFKDNEENLKNELKTLVEIFEIKETKSLDEIHEDILLLSRVDFIFNAVAGINEFIEKVNAEKTKFSEDIKDIILKLKEKKDIKTIKFCYNKLLDLKIIGKNKNENSYIDILIKFIEQPDSIIFLLENTIQEISNLQELASGSDNNYVTVNDIMDMGKCLEFFKDIKLPDLKSIQKHQDYEIIYILKENVSKKLREICK